MSSSNLNLSPSSPRWYLKAQPPRAKSSAPPGSSMTPSTVTNCETTTLPMSCLQSLYALPIAGKDRAVGADSSVLWPPIVRGRASAVSSASTRAAAPTRNVGAEGGREGVRDGRADPRRQGLHARGVEPRAGGGQALRAGDSGEL